MEDERKVEILSEMNVDRLLMEGSSPLSVQIHTQLTQPMAAVLRELAQARKVSVASLVRDAITLLIFQRGDTSLRYAELLDQEQEGRNKE